MEKLSLNCKGLDSLLDGGLEPAVITNVYGSNGSGKTNFAIQATVSCIKSNKQVIFIDAEGGFSLERFSQICDKKLLDRVILIEPKTFDEQDKVIKALERLLVPDTGLIVVDSLVSLYRLELHDKDVQEVNYKLSKQLAILSKISREKKIPILVTNQVYSDFDSGEIELVGRDIPRYACKCIIKLEKIGWGRRKATLIKHRSRPENLSVEFEIKNEGLVDVEKRFKLF